MYDVLELIFIVLCDVLELIFLVYFYSISISGKEIWCSCALVQVSSYVTTVGSGPHRPLVILDAAVLLDAQWPCDEIWVSFVPREEQIRRIVQRDKKSEAEAIKRIDSQICPP